MKCIQSRDGLVVKRVSDAQAAQSVQREGYKYVPKSVWKTQTRLVKIETSKKEAK